jgi:ACR3 family arsenite transporter
MVFVWSQLARGDAAYTLVQVSINDLIMIFAFAPIVALLLGVADIMVPWETLLLSVGLYVVMPLMAGYATRHWLVGRAHRAVDGDAAVSAFVSSVKPFSVIGLLATVVLLFGFQGNIIIDQPLLIALIAAPLIIQSYGIFFIAYGAAWQWRVPFNIAAPCALIGTSNFFELAVAAPSACLGWSPARRWQPWLACWWKCRSCCLWSPSQTEPAARFRRVELQLKPHPSTTAIP